MHVARCLEIAHESRLGVERQAAPNDRCPRLELVHGQVDAGRCEHFERPFRAALRDEPLDVAELAGGVREEAGVRGGRGRGRSPDQPQQPLVTARQAFGHTVCASATVSGLRRKRGRPASRPAAYGISSRPRTAGIVAHRGRYADRMTMTDTFGRPLRDLRISVTDRCNFRCVYCMPKEVFGRDYEFLAARSC